MLTDDLIEKMKEAVTLYGKWADRTGDYPHDEEGCGAHDAILEVWEIVKARE